MDSFPKTDPDRRCTLTTSVLGIGKSVMRPLASPKRRAILYAVDNNQASQRFSDCEK
jgi:hypothetical protein